MNLSQFVGKNQLKCMHEACQGEEGEYFKTMIKELKIWIAAMPQTYETENEQDPLCCLHYFKNGSDWYITERDAGAEEDLEHGIEKDAQLQAFGFACLNGDYQLAELGYISIDELISYGVELDLYWKPRTLSKVKAELEHTEEPEQTIFDLEDLETWMSEGTCPALDGCMVELDGHCPHGSPSMMLSMGLI